MNHQHWCPPGDSGDVLCFPRPGAIEREARTAALWVMAACVVLGVVCAGGYLLATAGRASAQGRAARVSCETFGFPAAIPGAPARVEWNGPIAFELDGKSRNAAWAMTLLTPESLLGEAVRVDRFRSDPRVPRPWRATLRDYEGSGYDRGHLLASAHFGSQADRDATFALTNIAPQHPDLNRRAWKQLEETIRGWVREGQSLVLVVLPLYPRAVDQTVTIRTIGPSDVWVPDRFAVAVLLLEGAQPRAMRAWIMPNDAVPPEAECRVSVDEVEAAAGFDLFWALDDNLEDRLEAARGH